MSDLNPRLPSELDTRDWFVVTDGGQKVASIYFPHEAKRPTATRLFSKDDARRIAANVAKLPELSRKP
jgi:hypothetical protein